MNKYKTSYISVSCSNNCKPESDWEYDECMFGPTVNCLCGVPTYYWHRYKIYASEEKRLEVKERREHNNTIDNKIKELQKQRKK